MATYKWRAAPCLAISSFATADGTPAANFVASPFEARTTLRFDLPHAASWNGRDDTGAQPATTWPTLIR